MIENRPIEPTHIIRFRWLYLLAIVPILAGLPIQMDQNRQHAMASIELSTQGLIEPPFLHLPDIIGYSLTHSSIDSDLDIATEFSNPRKDQKQQRDPNVSTPSTDRDRDEDEEQASQDPYMPIILAAASQYKVDPSIIRAIIMAESSYNPKAVSKKGAKGLMQLMPRTARSLGVEDSFNPEQNIHAGVKYFSQLLSRFDGDPALALAAYNAGSRKVRKYRGVPPFKATKRYIKKVFKYQQLFKEEMVRNG